MKFSRRTLLRASGVALGLPMLDSMSSAAGAKDEAPPRRMVAIQTNQGIMPHLFFPENAGKDYELSPYLQFFEPIRDKFTVFSGLSHTDVDGGHSNEQSFLTGAPHPAGAAFRNSISLDQVAAEQLGSETRFPFLTLSCSNGGNPGMSYTRSGVLIPPESSPTQLYRKLFVQGSEKEIQARVADLRSGRSLLDTVHTRAKSLLSKVGSIDKHRLDQYFTSIRELEQQFHQAEAWEYKPKPTVEMKEPQEIKDGALLISKLRQTLDVTRLALETDSTRFISLFISPLGVLNGIPGVGSETHSLTHHGNREEMIAELRLIEEAQLQAIRDFFVSLDQLGEGEGNLLGQTSIIYGTCMGNANGHTNQNWPMLLAGGGFKHGQHLAFDTKRNTPIANLFLSVLHRLGIEAQSFSSSTGNLSGLALT